MTSSLPLVVRRLLAIAILLAMVLATWTLIAAPIWRLFESQRETLQASVSRLSELEALAKQEPDLRKKFASDDVDSNLLEYLLPGTNPTVAAADLQEHLERVISQQNGTVRSVLSIAPVEEKDFSRVGLSLEFEIADTEIVHLCYIFMTEIKQMFFDDFDITPESGEYDSQGGNRTLSIRMRVFAFIPRAA